MRVSGGVADADRAPVAGGEDEAWAAGEGVVEGALPLQRGADVPGRHGGGQQTSATERGGLDHVGRAPACRILRLVVSVVEEVGSPVGLGRAEGGPVADGLPLTA